MHVIGTRTAGDGMLASSARSMPGLLPGQSPAEIESGARVLRRRAPPRRRADSSLRRRLCPAAADRRRIPDERARSARPRRFTRSGRLALRTIGSPALQENAAAKDGRFDGAPIARNCGSGWGFVFMRSFASSGRTLARPDARPPEVEALVGREARRSARGSGGRRVSPGRRGTRCARPPRSAIDSPRTSLPLTCWPSNSYASNWVSTHRARAS